MNNKESANTANGGNKKLGGWALNILGIAILIAAAFMYRNDLKKNRLQAEAANLVRRCGASPIINMGVYLDLNGPASNQLFVLRDVNIVSNIMASMVNAEPTDFPGKTVEGDEYKLLMVLTNHTLTVMRAVRLYDDPDNLYMGLEHPVAFNENKQPVNWGYTPPALVIGLGKTFKALADEHVPQMREIAPQFNAAVTDFEEQIKLHAQAGTANADATAPSDGAEAEGGAGESTPEAGKQNPATTFGEPADQQAEP